MHFLKLLKELERLEKFAQKNNYLVYTKQIDLNIANSLSSVCIFDNIIINHYRLSKEQLSDIKNHITNDGIFDICSFGCKNKVDSKISKNYLIRKTYFEDIINSFKLIQYVENQD